LLCSLANDQLKHLQYNTWREEEQYFFFKLNEILGAETGIVSFASVNLFDQWAIDLQKETS